MREGRGKDLVALVALLTAVAWGTWLYARETLQIGVSWTDGERSYQGIGGGEIRYAVWDLPEPLSPSINGEGAESRPALSPDGRYLVFAAGERGLNADLYVAEMVGGEALDPVPLTRLNSTLDELAPSFGADGLYFATDRSGPEFGLDIWRAPYADGVFGAPVALGSGLNSSADETDPSPTADGGLLFASNRVRGSRTDYELYRARHDTSPEATLDFTVEPLETLNTPFDEREPTLAADDHALIFASNRVGSQGGFDLYRSFLEDGTWLEPEALVGVNTPDSERGPLLSPDGFSLYFEVTEEERLPDLWRARSLELFRVPPAPLSLQEVLLLLALLLLALLAWLAKRWRTIDILYKCFLVSLLVHLLLMWYLHEVYPEPNPVVMRGDDRVFRVRLAPSPSGTPSESRELQGELQLEARNVEAPESTPERASAAAELAAASPQAIAAEAPERPEETRERNDVDLSAERSEPAAAAPLEERETPFERKGASAPALTVDVQASQAAPARDAADDPGRASVVAEASRAQPEASQLEAARVAGDPGSAAPAPRRLEREESGTAPAASTSVAQPRESFERASGSAPSLSLPTVAQSSAPELDAGVATRRSDVTAPPTAAPGAAQPAELDAAIPARSLDAPAGPRAGAAEAPLSTTQATTALREDPSERSRPATQTSRTFDATSDLATPAPERASDDARGTPERREAELPGVAVATPSRNADARAPTRTLEAPVGPRQSATEAPTAATLTTTALREDPTERSGPAAQASRTFDATSDLATPAPQRASGDARTTPERREAEQPGIAAAAPSPTADARTPTRALEAPIRPRRSAAEAPATRPEPSIAVRADAVERAEEAREDSHTFDATAGMTAAAAERRTAGQETPDRRAARAPDAAPAQPRRDVELALTTERPMPAAERGRARLSEPAPDARPSRDVAVRAVQEAPEERRTATEAPQPRRFDPTRELEVAAPARRPPTRESRAVPSRLDVSRTQDRARPESRALAAAPAPEPSADEAPERLEHTPYRNRFGDEKLRALEEFGGGVETERAVAAGLAYLASIQERRGNWGERRDFHDKYGDVRVGKTALSLLAFLGAGHTPQSDTEYSTVARDAIAYLLDTQYDNGHFGDSSSYGHGIATYALAECYAITADQRLVDPLRYAVRRIVDAQDRRNDPRLFGGWGYYYVDGRVWNGDRWPRVSVTSWQVMALESARLGGLEVPDRAFSNARQFLANAWDPRRDAFRYTHDPDRLSSGYPILPASTPAALFALSLLGIDVSSPELREARRFVLARAPRDYRYTSDDDFVNEARGNLYFWYYATLAMFRAGGDDWERWNAAMKDTLISSQAGNGSWEPISIYCEYAGDDDEERSYSTAMCVLTLEVYYRYFTPLLEVR